MISEADPRKFMTTLAQAMAGDGEIFLGNPDWGTFERKQVDKLMQQSGLDVRASDSQLSTLNPQLGWLMIPTGGTSGRVRFARHDAATIAAAVRGFTRHFSLPQVNAIGVLPLHHVSGLMAWMRCVLTGGEYRPLDWKAVEGGALPELPEKTHGWNISLVPTQLDRLLRNDAAVEWLKKFRLIFVGGGPVWPELLDKAAGHRLPISPGYGMTESAAMVAALLPEEFLSGARSCGKVLPHVRVSLGEEGQITLNGESLFRGYYPEWRPAAGFLTEDCGFFDAGGHLHVTGRRDAVIITGGEKVNPAEVETVLRGSGEFPDVVVIGLPDAEWGQLLVAVYPEAAQPNLARVSETMGRLLSPAKRPKQFIPLAHWPANAQGKVNRAEVLRLAGQALRSKID
jgi:O-succinylbenzoic acid--CoA ligase